MTRAQHIIPSGVVALLGLWITWVSLTQEPADAFLFPRLISSVFLVLALWTFGKAVLGLSKVGDGVSMAMARNLAPGLLVAAVYIFWGAKTLGFYSAGALAFLMLLSLYDPAPHSDPKVWMKRLMVTAGFIAVMYGLFALLLKVFTPRGIFM